MGMWRKRKTKIKPLKSNKAADKVFFITTGMCLVGYFFAVLFLGISLFTDNCLFSNFLNF